MNWLKTHEYLAVWLALPLAALIALIQNAKAQSGHAASTGKMIIYLAFLTCLCVVFTPVIDDGARFFAGGVALLLVFIISADTFDWH